MVFAVLELNNVGLSHGRLSLDSFLVVDETKLVLANFVVVESVDESDDTQDLGKCLYLLITGK